MITRNKYIDFAHYLPRKGYDSYYLETIKVGAVSMVYDKGKFGVGVSFCSLEDKFDKTEGIELARMRALKDLNDNPKTMRQLRGKAYNKGNRIDIKTDEEYANDVFKRFGGVVVPHSLKTKYNSLDSWDRFEIVVALTLNSTLESMRNAIVIEKIKEDTERA